MGGKREVGLGWVIWNHDMGFEMKLENGRMGGEKKERRRGGGWFCVSFVGVTESMG